MEISANQNNALMKNTSIPEQHPVVKEEDDNELSNSLKYCPDWTELTPTLEFPTETNNFGQQDFAKATNDSNKEKEGFLSTSCNEGHTGSKLNMCNDANNIVSMPENSLNVPNSSIETNKAGDVRNQSLNSKYFDNSMEHSTVPKLQILNNSEFESFQESPKSRGNLDTLLSSAASNAQKVLGREKSMIKMNQE